VGQFLPAPQRGNGAGREILISAERGIPSQAPQEIEEKPEWAHQYRAPAFGQSRTKPRTALEDLGVFADVNYSRTKRDVVSKNEELASSGGCSWL
jgi:hypothetical protein